MRLMHIAVACRSEKSADLFYGALLGLTRQEPKTIPVSIAGPLFGCDTPLPAVNYIGPALHVEVFLVEEPGVLPDRISHVCLGVVNTGTLLERAAALGFPVTRVPKGDTWVLFLDDSDGHRFEIKETVS